MAIKKTGIVTTLNNIVGYGLWYAVVGCVQGALLVSIIGGGIHEYAAGIPSGPVLMMLTGTIGSVCGILYGNWRNIFEGWSFIRMSCEARPVKSVILIEISMTCRQLYRRLSRDQPGANAFR